jgi:hypothetical protein
MSLYLLLLHYLTHVIHSTVMVIRVLHCTNQAWYEKREVRSKGEKWKLSAKVRHRRASWEFGYLANLRGLYMSCQACYKVEEKICSPTYIIGSETYGHKKLGGPTNF